MPNERIVAFDIDEVLYPFLDSVKNSLEQRFQTRLNGGIQKFYSLFEWLSREHLDIYQKLMQKGKTAHFNWMADNGFFDYPPYEGSVEVIKTLKERGKKIAIVTYRATEVDSHHIFRDGDKRTIEWLRKYELEFDYIEFTGSKAKALKKIENESGLTIERFVEDHPKNVIEASLIGNYKVALMDRPYNARNPPVISRLNSSNNDKFHAFTLREWHQALDSGLVTRVSSIKDVVDLV